MDRQLNKQDIEKINAWLDGELSQAEADQVAAKVAADPAWAEQAEQLRQLDAMLDQWKAPPLRRDLTDMVLAKSHRRRPLPTWVRALAPLAAAAVIVAAVALHYMQNPRSPGTPPDQTVHNPAPDSRAADLVVSKNLDFFRDYDENPVVLENYATLIELDKIENHPGEL